MHDENRDTRAILVLGGKGKTGRRVAERLEKAGRPEEAEAALRESGSDWTIICSSWFCQNFSEGIFLDPILSGQRALPVKPVQEPFIDVEDIADIAFAALTFRHGYFEGAR